jgi:CarboxypepD_reg-like domain
MVPHRSQRWCASAFLPLAALLGLCLGQGAVHPALAQGDSASTRYTGDDSSAVSGHLIDGHTREGIRGAQVEIAGAQLASTDTAGDFTLTGLAPGSKTVTIKAIGYAPATWRFTLKPRHVLKHTFELDPLAVELPEVVVKGKTPLAERRFADFERRRHHSMGYFLTQEQIERSGAASLVDVLVTVRGVEQVCLTNDCVAKMVRSPPGCYPQYYLDGNESTSYFARLTPPHDVKGVEIYRGSSETPGEFQGSNSGCGVIAIWTKSSP